MKTISENWHTALASMYLEGDRDMMRTKTETRRNDV